MLRKKGQVAMDVAALILIVAAALAAMSGTIKSFIMGGWFKSAQQLGEPYSPEAVGTITNTLTSTTVSHVNSITNGDSLYSLRIDMGLDNTEIKTGTLTIKEP